MINWVFPWSLNTFVKAPAARSSEKKEGEKKETCPLKRMSATWHQIPTLKKQFIKHLARPKTVPAETMHRFKKRKRKKPKNSVQVSKIFTTWTFDFENFQANFSRKILFCFEGNSFVQNGGQLRSPRVRASYQVGENLFSSGLHLSFFEFHRSFRNMK